MLCHSIYLQVVKVHLINYSISRVSYVHSSRTTDESLHFRIKMLSYSLHLHECRLRFPVYIVIQSLKDISYNQIFFFKDLRETLKYVDEFSELKKRMTKLKREHTHTSLSLSLLVDPPMHFDFPKRMCMHQSPSLFFSLYLHLQKRFGSRSDPNGIQERLFPQLCDRKYAKCCTKADAHKKMGLQYISKCIHLPVPCMDPEGGKGGPDPPP